MPPSLLSFLPPTLPPPCLLQLYPHHSYHPTFFSQHHSHHFTPLLLPSLPPAASSPSSFQSTSKQKFSHYIVKPSDSGKPLKGGVEVGAHPAVITQRHLSLLVSFLSFFGGSRVWTQGLTLARQVLYQNSYKILSEERVSELKKYSEILHA
jgi:hypothetical protein